MSKERLNNELSAIEVKKQEILTYCDEGNIPVRRDAFMDQVLLVGLERLRLTHVDVVINTTDPKDREYYASELRVVEIQEGNLRYDIFKKRESNKEYFEAESHAESLLNELYSSCIKEAGKMTDLTEDKREHKKDELWEKATGSIYYILRNKHFNNQEDELPLKNQ